MHSFDFRIDPFCITTRLSTRTSSTISSRILFCFLRLIFRFGLERLHLFHDRRLDERVVFIDVLRRDGHRLVDLLLFEDVHLRKREEAESDQVQKRRTVEVRSNLGDCVEYSSEFECRCRIFPCENGTNRRYRRSHTFHEDICPTHARRCATQQQRVHVCQRRQRQKETRECHDVHWCERKIGLSCSYRVQSLLMLTPSPRGVSPDPRQFRLIALAAGD